jgi:hypothetical protein
MAVSAHSWRIIEFLCENPVCFLVQAINIGAGGESFTFFKDLTVLAHGMVVLAGLDAF